MIELYNNSRKYVTFRRCQYTDKSITICHLAYFFNSWYNYKCYQFELLSIMNIIKIILVVVLVKFRVITKDDLRNN